jgi:hypothetical protein
VCAGAVLSAAQLAPKSEYINENLDLFYALYEVGDLDFESMPMERQEELMRTLVIEKYEPGKYIVSDFDESGDALFVVASEATKKVEEVESTKVIDGK